jgi:hypothetical protein
MRSAEPVPIACTLNPQFMAPRLADIKRLTTQFLRSHRLAGRTLLLTYERAAAEEIHRIVQLERACCAFLDFRLHEAADGVELTITAPEQEGSGVQWLFAQFLPQVVAPSPSRSRPDGCACCGT